MTPRSDLITINKDSQLDEVIKIINQSGRSRIPITGENLDDIKGIILAKDLFRYLVGENKNSFNLADITREAYFVNGDKFIDELFDEFKIKKIHFAIVLDEHGGVDGIVSLEDLLEEIVGEIFDESDKPEFLFLRISKNEALVDAGMTIQDVNEKFSVSLPEGEYDTIAGYVFETLGKIPTEGEELVLELDKKGTESPDTTSSGDSLTNLSSTKARNFKIVVDKVDSHRIERVRLVKAA